MNIYRIAGSRVARGLSLYNTADTQVAGPQPLLNPSEAEESRPAVHVKLNEISQPARV